MALSFSLVNLFALFDESDRSSVEVERKSIAEVTNLPSLTLLIVTIGLPSATDLQIASVPYLPERTKHLLYRMVSNCQHFVIKLLHTVALLLSFRLEINCYKTDRLCSCLLKKWCKNGSMDKIKGYEFSNSALN